MEEEPELAGNPFKEIENYDIYYWGGDRIFHPRVIQICSNPKIYPEISSESHQLGLNNSIHSPIPAPVGEGPKIDPSPFIGYIFISLIIICNI
jgi:hypothetical protein